MALTDATLDEHRTIRLVAGRDISFEYAHHQPGRQIQAIDVIKRVNKNFPASGNGRLKRRVIIETAHMRSDETIAHESDATSVKQRMPAGQQISFEKEPRHQSLDPTSDVFNRFFYESVHTYSLFSAVRTVDIVGSEF